MVDIAILDYSTCEVVMVKVDEAIIEKKFNNNLEAFMKAKVEEGGLEYDIDTISYMCHDKIKVTCMNGSPRGGIEIEAMDSLVID